MWDIILEFIRTVVICLILLYIWRIGHARGLNHHKGWWFIISGWSLILFGSALDITDNFESLNWLVVIGDTETEAFLEKFVGFLIGYILLFIGFILWLPEGARKINSLKKDFVSTVSHELRTPLTSIYGSIKLVSSGRLGELPPKAKEVLNIALRNSERLTVIVNDILDIEKLESGKMPFDLKPHNILELVNDAIAANSNYGQEYHIQYFLNPDSVSARANVDDNRFMQVMNNLLSNAAKFSPQGSTVEIKVSTQNNNIRVAVKDHGIGIDQKSWPLIFQKFFQTDSSDERHSSGSGLGLSISKAYIEKMGGNIGFTSSPGEGSTFYFNLPEC
ncbi:MAG: HAMP domain-containing histidine kinase [Gammaproteobacteria bacterium]|nr:HAMP domain-containing histidine kinase [Gammaproteobacteria bacterium]